MKGGLIGGGLFIIIFICLVPLYRDIEEYDIQNNGQIITATITYIPNCVGTKGKHFMKFNYEGQIFDKSIGCSFGDTHKVGDIIKFKHSKGTDIFLFENEKKEIEFISSGLLALFGIFCIFKGVRQK